MRTSAIAYGGDYNPDQWDDSYLDNDIELMLEAGVNVVTLAVFSWSKLEPRPGVYEFGWLRRVMDRLHSAGIGVDLATATASPPPWLGAEYPETLPVTGDGVRLTWGSRQQYNPSSALFREKVSALVERLAAEFGDHPAIVAWHVGNEYACHVDQSFDEESAARFRVWLDERHGSLDGVNAAWGTAFWSQRLSTWDEVIPPRATTTIPNPHHLTDWRTFSSDMLLELYLLEREILHRVSPGVPVTTNFMGLFGKLDYWKWAEHVDFVSNDTYPDPADPRSAREFAFECDLMRSLGKGQPFIQMEQVTTAVQWRPRNARKRPGQYALWSLQAVAHGADGILNFQWRQSLAGAEAFHGAMVPHAGREGRTWGEVTALGSALKELDAVRGATLTADVAIVWDWESAWAQDAAVGPIDGPVPAHSARAWHASLFERGHVVDFVHPDHDLSEYKIVVIPALFRMTETHAQRIREAASAGTTIVVTYLSGYVDALGHAIPGGYLRPIADVLGARVVDVSPLAVEPTLFGRSEPLDAGIDRVTAAISSVAHIDAVGLVDAAGDPWAGDGLGWAEGIIVDDDVDVVARFDGADWEGSPAITVRRTEGQGAGWYVGTDLDARGRDTLLETVLRESGLEKNGRLPAGVEVVSRGGVTFVLNHGDAAATFECVSGTVVGSGVVLDNETAHVPPRDALLLTNERGITA